MLVDYAVIRKMSLLSRNFRFALDMVICFKGVASGLGLLQVLLEFISLVPLERLLIQSDGRDTYLMIFVQARI